MNDQPAQSPCYKLRVCRSNPYADLIERFVIREFPSAIKSTKCAILELVTDAIVASGQIRYGPVPSPESLVAMREVIRHYVGQSLPIPFVSPWGSEKPDGTGVDVAELGAIKTLCCLNARVKAVYPPGVEFSLRVEDLCAPHLFFERMDEARREAKLYTDGLIALVKVLGVNSFITVSPDSLISDEPTFNALADYILPAMEYHLKDINSPKPIAELKALGWDKPVAQETIDHYLAGYEKLYPDRDMKFKIHVLARYFASSLARKKMGMTGVLPRWKGKYLDLYFGKTPPGLEPTRYLRRIHYRTLPCSITTNHMAPWRAKGYLRIGDNKVTAALASCREDIALNKFQITLENNGLQQAVQTDYIVV